MGNEKINIDELRKWNLISKIKVDGVKASVTVLHDEPLPEMDTFVDKNNNPKRKTNPFKERKLKRDHWDNISEKSKTIIQCRESEDILKIYYPFDRTTGERLMNFWFSEDYNPTITISGAIQIERDIKKWFFPKKHTSISEEGTIVRESVRDKYFVDIMEALIEKEGTTVKEIAQIIGIKEQYMRTHLNNLEKTGLLKTFRYSKGKKLYRFALSKSKLSDIKIVLGL